MLACSGGIDSSALLLLAGIAVQRAEIAPFSVVHVNHLTRPESATEGAVVEQLAARFDLRTIQAVIDPTDADSSSSSPEDRLRTLRYTALARVAAEHGLSTVVTAHTRDDQIETILMRLFGGSGGLGAAGMSARSSMATRAGVIEIHRPLLDVCRDELVYVLQQLAHLLQEAGISPLIDPSNADRHFRRNALRHDIIPQLSRTFPGYEPALIRSVRLASRDADALDAIASDIATRQTTIADDTTSIEREFIRSSHPALSSRVIRRAVSRLMPDDQRELTFERIESVREAASGRTGAVIELPDGVVARIERENVVLERRNSQPDGK
ncbi:MAG: tRNA lysidine(34) synthetase TilS [Chloroflexota bacterium]|nr:tRNA lysidine(34) synthetase TilS [Chloroflexota bacterium]